MMPRIAILTPDPADEAFHSRWRDVFEHNAGPLREAGLVVEDRSWGDAEDLAEFDLVLPLLVWGYVRAYDRWIEKIAEWEQAGVRLQNPPSVMRWNADKSYLGRLAERGAPVVPALYVDQATPEVMSQAARTFGTDRLVAKPRISHSAWRTIRWSPDGSLEGGPTGAAIVQPYLERIETSGELSLLWFAGRFSHAIRKVPQPGDFRVQPEYDGIITACRPDADELEAARRVMAAVEEDVLYARIDLARGPDGAPALIELELIEPDLYLGYDAAGACAFASAVIAAALRTQDPAASTRVARAP